MINKKGISPLIATVLIIGFTIAVAVMIMTWGVDLISGITGSTTNKAAMNKDCVENVILKVENIQCNNMTTNPFNLTMLVKNNGGKGVYRLRYRMTDANNSVFILQNVSTDTDTPILSANGIVSINLEINDTDTSGLWGGGNNLRQLEIIPTILSPENKEFSCPNILTLTYPCTTGI